MNLGGIKAVIFDFDGTLYDNSGIARKLILAHPLHIFRIGNERKVRRALFGRDFENTENYFKACGETGARLFRTTPERFLLWYRDFYIPQIVAILKKKHYAARTGVAECFLALKERNIKIAVFSDYPRVKERMAAVGIEEDAAALISGIYTSEDFGCLKPAPRAFLQIAADLKAKPKECLVIGDRDDTDGQGARSAGMKFIQIKTKKMRPKENKGAMDWKEFLAFIKAASI